MSKPTDLTNRLARGDKLRAYWVRWRNEQRKRKATEAREALETEGQLPLVLVPREGADPDYGSRGGIGMTRRRARSKQP